MNLLILAQGLIFGGGVAALLLHKRFSLMKAVSVILIFIGCLLGLYGSVVAIYGETFQISLQYLNEYSLSFKVDPLSAFFLITIFLVSALSTLFSYHYMENSEKSLRTGVNYFFYSLLIISMGLVVTADNIITFILCWEVMSLSSFFLVIYNYEKKDNRNAGLLYFVFSHVGAMFILACFGLLYSYNGTFDFTLSAEIPESVKILIFVLGFIGLGSKAGVFPFHIWLPHAHPAAPSHISALMSGVMIKTGIYGILRLYLVLDCTAAALGYMVIGFGIVSGILGVVYALGQNDIKRILAYSSVENIGVILIGLGIGMTGISLGNPAMAALGFVGGLMHVLNHGIFKSILFMGAGIIVHKTGTRSMDMLGGLLKNMKVTGTAFIVGAVAISGLPPFNGFVSEFFIYFGSFKGVSQNGAPFALSVIAIVSLAVIGGLALACFTRLVGIILLGEPRSEKAQDVNEDGPSMLIAMTIGAVLCIFIGVLPQGFIGLSGQAAFGLIPDNATSILAPHIEMTKNITCYSLLFLGVVLGTAVLRKLLYRGKEIGSEGTWGCGFTQPTVKMQYTGFSFSSSIIDFFKQVAPVKEKHETLTGRFAGKSSYKSEVGDLAEMHLDKIVRPISFIFDKLRFIQHGDIHLYICYILVALILLMLFV
jgi:hydrogenase-4 component B